jgi:hypothetical protein
MVVRRAVLALLSVAALLLGMVGIAPPASAAADTTLFTMTGDSGDYIAGPTTYTYTGADSTFTPQGGIGSGYISVIQGSYTHWWYVSLAATTGSDFVAGTTYSNAQRSADASHAGLDVSGDGRGCNQTTGSITVLEIARDPGTDVLTRFAATFEQHCEGGTPAARGRIYFHSTLAYDPDASMTITAASVRPTGAPVAIGGTLSDGTNPIAGATLAVSRTDGAGTQALPDATTASDGSYAVSDTMPTTDATYQVSFAGNDAVQPMTASAVVKNGPYPSTLVITAPTTGTRGVAYRVTGVIRSDGALMAGATVTWTRKDLAGTRSFNLVSNASGVVTYRDVPAVGGPVTWTLSYAGDATHAAVRAAKIVTIARSSTALSIRSSASSYAVGARATITVHLGTTYNRRDVYVYARPLGPNTPPAVPGTLLAHVRVNSLGNAVVTYVMRARTTFTVTFSGDYRYLPATRAVAPNVVPKIYIGGLNYSSVSGGYYVFRGTTAQFRARPNPIRRSGCVYFAAQIYAGGRWQNYGSVCATIRSDYSYYAFAYTDRMYVGYKFRVRAYVGSTTYSLGGTSVWLYYKFA